MKHQRFALPGLLIVLAGCGAVPQPPAIYQPQPSAVALAATHTPSATPSPRLPTLTVPPTAVTTATSVAASATPTLVDTAVPTIVPAMATTPATAIPTKAPTIWPTSVPTARPSRTPLPLPTAAPTAAPTAPPVQPPAAAQPGPHYRVHVVAPGETLDALTPAGGSTADVLAYNHLQSATLRVGQPLILAADDPAQPRQRVLVERGNPARPRVALTFDAGASAAPTPKLLAALRQHQVRVTFFLTGKWMRDYPDLVREIVADGHEIANHSFHHPDFTTLDDATIARELSDTENQAQQIAGVTTRPFFRPPYGAYNKHMLDVVIDRGFLPIYWTFDSLDSVGQPKSPEFLTERVTTRLSRAQLNGAIILMHCGSEATAVAMPAILDRFAAMDVEVTTISAVLGP